MFLTHLAKACSSCQLVSLIVQVGTRSLSKLGGLGSKLPITAVCAVIGALTIMGVPPTSGFHGRMDVILRRIRNCTGRRK